jgi:hypothetical protein
MLLPAVASGSQNVRPFGSASDTGAPALVIYTFESSVAGVDGASPHGSPWYAILNPASAKEYGMPDFGPTAEIAARMATWAEEAGLVADLDRVAAAIEMAPGPFSEGVGEFLDALGFRFGAYISTY